MVIFKAGVMEKNCGCFVNFFLEAEGCWKESSIIEISRFNHVTSRSKKCDFPYLEGFLEVGFQRWSQAVYNVASGPIYHCPFGGVLHPVIRKLPVHCLSDGHEVWSAEHRTLSHVFGCLVKGNWVKQAWYWKNTYIDINITWYFHEQYRFPVCVFLGFGVIFDWRVFLRDFPRSFSSRFGCGDSPRHLRDADSLRKWVKGSHLMRNRIFQQKWPPCQIQGCLNSKIEAHTKKLLEKIVTSVVSKTGFFQDWMSWDTPMCSSWFED